MNISNETQQKINQFAKVQSQYYLDEAEMTYMEQLRRKGANVKDKITTKLSKFKNNSEQSKEARDDMILYMNDYMNDLMAGGMTEQEAFEKAKGELAFESKTTRSNELLDKYQEYYQPKDPALYEAIGLYYAAGCVIGLVIGVLAGILLNYYIFKVAFLIPVIIGGVSGLLLGTAFGMIMHATIVHKSYN